MKRVLFVLTMAAVILTGLLCRGEGCGQPVLQKYIAAFNARDEAALREVVADTASYIGHSKTPRNLIEQNKLSWTHPATANSRVALGEWNGTQVIVVWTKPKLQDGTLAPWTRGVLLTPICGNGRILHMNSRMILFEPEVQKSVKGEPPKE
jgi:hypothetical protein